VRHAGRRPGHRPASARAMRDAVMIPIRDGLWHANYRVCAPTSSGRPLAGAGHEIGRNQVARLIRAAGIGRNAPQPAGENHQGQQQCAPRHPDRVSRYVTAHRSNALWTRVSPSCRPGRRRVCVLHRRRLATDRRLAVATSMRTDMVSTSSDMTRWSSGTRRTGSLPSRQLVNELRFGGRTSRDRRRATTLGWVHGHSTEQRHIYPRDVPQPSSMLTNLPTRNRLRHSPEPPSHRAHSSTAWGRSIDPRTALLSR
jgi:putative transposase